MSGEIRFVRIRGRIIPIRQKAPTAGQRVAVGAYGAVTGGIAGHAAGQIGAILKTQKSLGRAQGLLRKSFEIHKRGLSPAFAKRFSNAMPMRPSVLPVVRKATPLLDDAMKLASGTILKARYDRTMKAVQSISRLAPGRIAKAGKIGAFLGAAAFGTLYATKAAQDFSDLKQAYKKSKMKPGFFDFASISKKR